MDRATTGRPIATDLRFAVFNLIYEDRALRALLAKRREPDPDRAPGEATGAARLLVLQWSADERESAAAGHELLTVHLHVPLADRGRHWHVDLLLQRLSAALTGPAARRSIRARCLGRWGQTGGTRQNTLLTTCTWRIAHASAAPERTMAASRLAPWRGGVGMSAAGLFAAGAEAFDLN